MIVKNVNVPSFSCINVSPWKRLRISNRTRNIVNFLGLTLKIDKSDKNRPNPTNVDKCNWFVAFTHSTYCRGVFGFSYSYLGILTIEGKHQYKEAIISIYTTWLIPLLKNQLSIILTKILVKDSDHCVDDIMLLPIYSTLQNQGP